MSGTETGDIDWPAGWDRTPAHQRKSYPGGFEVTRRRSIDDLLNELRSWGADEIKLETGAEHQKRNPHLPYANATADDPAAVAYFEKGGEQYAIACDKWDNLRDNIRAIGKYVEHKRMLPKYGITTAEAEFETAKLPPAGDYAVAGDEPAHRVLNVERDAPDDEIKAAARHRKKNAHPDNGGSAEKFQRIVEAEEAMLDE